MTILDKWFDAGSINIGNAYSRMSIKERQLFNSKHVVPERFKKEEK